MFVVGAVVVGGAIVHSNHSRYSRHSQYSDASKVLEIEEQKRLLNRTNSNFNSEKRALQEQLDECKQLLLENMPPDLSEELNMKDNADKLDRKVRQLLEQRLEKELEEDRQRLADIDATLNKILEIQLNKKR